MEQLVRAGLCGTGLIPVHTSEMVERYNACLEAVGLTPTGLGRFHVDGVGWSPEIAEERGDPAYLSPADAGRAAIVVTPDQHERPVLYPFFTFESQVMKSYFDRFMTEIADLTSQEGLWLDVDAGISSCRSLADLLLIRDVTVRTFSTGCLAEAASEQQRLVRTFLREEHAWADARLRRAIMASATEHGDLRERRLVIPEMVFSETECFYTRAFGGVYVFRDTERRENLVVLQQPSPSALADTSTAVWSLTDPCLPERLFELGLVELDFASHAPDTDALKRVRDAILAEAAWSCDPAVPFDRLTGAQRRRWVRKAGDKVPPVFFDLERLILRLDQPKPVESEELSPELRLLLFEPASHLPQTVRRVLWHLLGRINSLDVVRLHRHDPEHFVNCYRQWADAKKAWAIAVLKKHRCKEDAE